MSKLINIIGVSIFFIFLLVPSLFCEEAISITTYYPSPYGSYNELTTSGNTYLATTSGNVGIGTASPGSYKLDVNGQIRTTNDSPVKPNAGQWGGYSDKRLKKNIKPLRGALEKISLIQGSTFKWINPESHVMGERAGVIAQDLQQIFPEWVSYGKPEGNDKNLIPDGEDVLVVTFPGDFNAYLIEAIKELRSENDGLKAKDAQLESRIKVLEEQLKVE